MVRCSSDVEYLCKLHCIRVAFQWLFKDKSNWEWFATGGRQILADLLLCAGKVRSSNFGFMARTRVVISAPT